MQRAFSVLRAFILPGVVAALSAFNCFASIVTNVSASWDAMAHAESWVFSQSQGVFVPVVPVTEIVLSSGTSGIAATGFGTSASAQFDVSADSSRLEGSFSTKGIHYGGAKYIAPDMYQFFDNFYANCSFICEFDLT